MANDVARLMNDLNVLVSTMFPDTDMNVLPVRLEEVLCNYNIERKSDLQMDKDLPEKVQLYLASKKIEGLSSKTLGGYKIELKLFTDYCKKPTALVNTADIRGFLESN
jgi:hypothetical protein